MAVRLEIHPAIGVARVGNSADHFVFAGPASDNLPRRDATGRLLRQAAEFRVYQVDRDANGQVVSAVEMTAANSRIAWSVHLANRKAAAPRFNGNGRRNNSTGNDNTDRALIIDCGNQTVSNPGDTKALSGSFQNHPVQLGNITVAPNGRLLVLAGDGSANSLTHQPIVNFADNDGWFDTVGDGVVRAMVTPTGGQASEALAAWVIVAPPDFAPGIANLVTMHDVLVDLAISRTVLTPPQTIVFTRHIRPILERAMRYQWVNSAARMGYSDSLSGGHSSGAVGDFTLQMNAYANPNPPHGTRERVFKKLRDPDAAPSSPNRLGMPRLNDDGNSGDVFSLTHMMYRAMRLWSLGQFVTDAPADNESEPDMLTRVALEACAGGPFFPGIEAGRVMRDAARYVAGEAFRLSPDNLKPGEVTQNNAVPWQADFWQCRWEEQEDGSRKRLGWWPAQRPDDVLQTATADPVPWARGIPDSGEGMVDNWHRLGVVKEVPAGSGNFLEQERDTTLPDIGIV